MIEALTRTLAKKSALAALVLAPAMLLSTPAPALAQDELSEARLRKIEAEIRALQRNVFPGGDGQFFEPQIRPDQTSSTRTSGPSTTAVTDILVRLDAMETQLSRLTGITEENANAIALLTNRMAAVEMRSTPLLAGDTSVTGPGAAQGTPAALAATQAAAPAATQAGVDGESDGEDSRAMDSNLAAMGAAKEQRVQPASPSSLPTPVPSATSVADAQGSAGEAAAPSPERLAAVQAIAKPQTDDPADDEYSYGFRLWNAGFYPEARQQLAKFLEDYPDHWRVTYGRNLLGRAYLDDGKTEEAARWFLRNYQEDRTAVRAPDSLLYLAEAMIAREDARRACIALAEFGETYPAIATGRLLEQYQANRAKVNCEG